MDNELLARIEIAMDKAMEGFLADEDSIFNNYKEQKKLKYSVVKQFKNWKKTQTCIVRNCNNKSIERSHTIQKSSSIKEISENGHVLAPRFNYDTGKMEMTNLGINQASTFPGYCSEHENLFVEFENRKDFESEEHLALQLYRTICREIVINEYHLDKNKYLHNSYLEYRDKKIGESIIDDLGAENIQSLNFSVENFKFKSNDSKIKSLKEQRIELERYLNEFLFKMNEAVQNDIKKGKFQKIECIPILINFKIPVALAGRGNFYSKRTSNSKSKLIEFIFNVLPLEGKTYILISTLKKYTIELRSYISQFKHPLQLLCLIERWMIYGSDHWFIGPSVWNKLNTNYQSKILESILDDNYNIGHVCKLSIFNDIKNECLLFFEEHDKEVPDFLRSIINEEKEKITFANKS